MPLFGKDITVGLEISGRVWRGVQIEHDQVRPRLLALETEELPSKFPDALNTDGPIWKMARSCRKSGRLVVNVPGSVAMIRKVKVEASEMGHLRDWVEWEAQQYLSGPLEEYFLDYQRLRSHDESGLWEVMLVIARREAIRERTRLFEKVHLRPAIMDVDPLALQNAFEVNYPGAIDHPVALVNLEGDLVTLVATRQGVPESATSLSLDPDTAKLSQQIQAGLADLLKQIAPANEENAQFVKVLLSGGGPHLQDVANFLASQDELDVELADPFRELAILPTLREKLDQTYHVPEFMLATGLALRKA